HDGTVTQKLLWHQMREPKPLRSLRGDVPAGLERVIARMMAKAPADRYETPGEVADALLRFAEGPYIPAALANPNGDRSADRSGSASGAATSSRTRTPRAPSASDIAADTRPVGPIAAMPRLEPAHLPTGPAVVAEGRPRPVSEVSRA